MEQKKLENYESLIKKQKREESFFMIIMSILIVLIIIIFLFIHCLGFITNKPHIPTGNVDIYDIIFENGNYCSSCNCGCSTNSSNLQCNCNSPQCICNGINLPLTDNENSNSNYNKEENSTLGRVQVYDEKTSYEKNTQLNIFRQTSYYVVSDKIAPTSENTYQFVIRNNNNFNIKYNLEITELNIYNINMRYRLKLNGKYVVGNNNEYVTVDELNRYNIALSNNTYDVYTLDWKWVEGENDTMVGTNIESYYKLDMKITASQI